MPNIPYNGDVARVVSSEPVRFTPDQRDALILVAARLQAEHEATVGAEELALAAREAGIEPRFLGEAAALLQRERPRVSPGEPLGALARLALFDLLFFGVVERHWFFSVAPALQPLILAAAAAAFFAVVCLEAILSVAAVEFAREACRLQARLGKRRPQS